MNKKNQQISIDIILIIFLLAILYSKTLLTLSMIILLLASFIQINFKNRFVIQIRTDLKSNFKSYLKTKPYLAVNLLFFMIMLSGINSENTSQWLHQLNLKLPFLFLPFAFYSLGSFSKKKYYRFFYYFFIVMVLSTIPIIAHYLENKEELDLLIKKGQLIPTPIDHIKYSLLLAIAVISGFILVIKKHYIFSNKEIYLIATFTIFIFFFLHVLAVRSGIITVYATLFILLLKELWFKSKSTIIIILIALISMPILAFNFIPSFKNKIEYMVYDFEMFKKNDGMNYSDSGRIYSWIIGKELALKSPILGTGIGDLKDECKKSYKEIYPNKNLKTKYPHNQYLFILAGTGVIGLILFLFAIFYPLLYKQNFKEPIFLGVMIIMIISFFVENTIERSYSTGMYLLFILIALNYLTKRK